MTELKVMDYLERLRKRRDWKICRSFHKCDNNALYMNELEVSGYVNFYVIFLCNTHITLSFKTCADAAFNSTLTVVTFNSTLLNNVKTTKLTHRNLYFEVTT